MLSSPVRLATDHQLDDFACVSIALILKKSVEARGNRS